MENISIEKPNFDETGNFFNNGDANSFISISKSSQHSRKKGSSYSCSSSQGEPQNKITFQRLKEIALELGIIKLCWSQQKSQE